MSACNIDALKLIGKYLNTSVATVCYNTDKVLTAVINKQNVEGFASTVLSLASSVGVKMNFEQNLLSYQWLEHISMYANQAAVNPVFAKIFLQGINNALEKDTYLTGQSMTIADVAIYYILYPILERLSITERECYVHVCRWSKHIQSQPKVCESRTPLPLNTIHLSVVTSALN